MKRDYIKWYSPILNKEMEMLVFGQCGTPVLFFPTRTARFYDYENWRIIESLQPRITQGELRVFCVDSFDGESFYSFLHPAEKIKKHLAYEAYILQEVIPFIQSKSNNQPILVAGCSLGGYHAVNIAMRHPQHFYKVVGMSARYDLTLSSHQFPDLLDGYFDENIYFNMPSRFLPNLTDDEILKMVRNLQVILAVGKEDPFLYNNVIFVQALNEKKVIPEFHIWNEEAHRAYYWRKMVQLYI